MEKNRAEIRSSHYSNSLLLDCDFGTVSYLSCCSAYLILI